MQFASSSSFMLLLAFSSAGGSQAQQPEESAADFQQRLSETFQQEIFDNQLGATAMWVGVSDPLYGDLFWTFKTPNSTEAVTLDDYFDIGSISKTFGGTIALLLQEDGELVLSDTVDQLVPALAREFPFLANYTVEELLRMQTLIPDFEPGWTELALADPSIRLSLEEQIALIANEYPGMAGQYSSTNFSVLHLILESITNMSMGQLVQDMILTPLGFVHTVLPPLDGDGVYLDPASVPYLGDSCFAETYSKYPNPSGGAWAVGDDILEPARSIVQTGIAGSMYSNIGELLEWAKTGTGDTLLLPASVEARHQYNSAVAMGAVNYGIAQFQYSPLLMLVAPDWYGHSGGTLGYYTDCYRNDVFGASFASCVNSCSGDLGLQFLALYEKELASRGDVSTTTAPASMAPVPTEAPTSLAPVSFLRPWGAILVGFMTLAAV